MADLFQYEYASGAGYRVWRGPSRVVPVATFVTEEEARDYCAYRNRLVDERGTTALDDWTAAENGGRTGWPPGMLQDDSRALSRALASKPDAKMRAREAAAAAGASAVCLNHFINAARINASDAPHTVVEKLQAAIDARTRMAPQQPTLEGIEAVDDADNQWLGDMMILQVLADSDNVNDQEREVLTRWMAASDRPSVHGARQLWIVEYGAIDLPMGDPSRVTAFEAHETEEQAQAALAAMDFNARMFAVPVPACDASKTGGGDQKAAAPAAPERWEMMGSAIARRVGPEGFEPQKLIETGAIVVIVAEADGAAPAETPRASRRQFTGGSGPCGNCGKGYWDHYGLDCDRAGAPEVPHA